MSAPLSSSSTATLEDRIAVALKSDISNKASLRWCTMSEDLANRTVRMTRVLDSVGRRLWNGRKEQRV